MDQDIIVKIKMFPIHVQFMETRLLTTEVGFVFVFDVRVGMSLKIR